ncbi:hypothetical protein GOHSU_08_00290 [Gordonia hirsuta DSM 44140 = NBRC 16056]|uniref:Uncharacterized protein n=1 Tax=Gordonia hirsuta DSM 44140 = NBRC 16056 TaxID=1121927 RepID=L7L703_9ACTN|nr:hypothetical protein [Gordonia hirsuta]GAC56501.1 hypothetical protein GOHSU_08_00290 [Gordonia hirsuta DSM 44140 = NBRC 16056]
MDAAKGRLAPTGLGEATIGQSLDEVVAANPGFPTAGRRDGDRIIIVWKDCTYTFDAKRTLIAIAPGDPAGAGGVTIDGVKAGTPGSRAVQLYGTPSDDNDGVATFVADKKAGTGYRIGYRDGADISRGTVTTVVLCRCGGSPAPAQQQGHGEPVLGRDKFERYAVGFGTVRPASISIASTAASSVGSITWQSWGGSEATGTGRSQQNGPANPQSTTYLRAGDVGWCDGVWAYRSLRRSGSPTSGGVTDDICKGDRREPSSSGSGGITLSPSSLLTFGGAGGVYVGDSSAKIPDTYLERRKVEVGMFPPGTELFVFKRSASVWMEAGIRADPSGTIEEFTWNATEQGVRVGSMRTQVLEAYRGYRHGRCTVSSASGFGDFFQGPASGRYLVAAYDSDERVVTFKARPKFTDGAHCGFE